MQCDTLVYSLIQWGLEWFFQYESLQEKLPEISVYENKCLIEKNQLNLNVSIPHEIALEIFKILSFEDLNIVCLVSKKWNSIGTYSPLWRSFDLKKYFPNVCFFNEDWVSKARFDCKISLFNNRHIISILMAPCPFSKTGEKIFQTHKFLEMPENLSLIELAKAPKTLYQDKKWMHFPYILRSFEKYESMPIAKTHCLLIKNNFLDGGFSKTYERQNELLAEYPEYELPGVVTVVAFLIAKFFISSENKSKIEVEIEKYKEKSTFERKVVVCSEYEHIPYYKHVQLAVELPSIGDPISIGIDHRYVPSLKPSGMLPIRKVY
jgi:hypothetical protein